MISLFASTLVMRFATVARSGLTGQRRLPAVLLTTTALLLGITGSASAGVWRTITLNTANWSGNAGFGSVAPAAYLDIEDVVHLQGAVTQTAQTGNPNFIGTLPAGYQPDRAVYTIVHTFNGTYADLSIGTNGQIFLIPSSATGTRFVSLEGITYQPGNASPVTPINLNTANWSGNVCCGASGPGVYVTHGNSGDAVVHLQGAVTQTSSSGSNPNFIGNLPFVATAPVGDQPHRNVYTIVHTFGGTYADLEITASGQIFLLPLVGTITQSDTRFVSLEGISFPVLDFGVFGPNPDPNPGWGDGGFGALAPIVGFEDSNGFIHLEGAVSQILCCTPIYTLPPALAPSRNLFFVVQTFGGTFADLSIGTNGTINVIPAAFPKPSNLTFLSVEGITYDAPSPKFFDLRVRGPEHKGATVTVMLRKPRALALLVQVVRGRRLVTVGAVRLGTHPAGRSRIHWSLRVRRRLLPAGRYEVSLHALNGKLLSVPARPRGPHACCARQRTRPREVVTRHF